jgi:uncharacterized DUF497 family protein
VAVRYCVWDDPARPRSNRRKIAEHDVTVEEVEEVLNSNSAEDGLSDSSGLPTCFGWTSTGRHIVVVYKFQDEGDGFEIVKPITAYEVPPRSSRRS